MQCVGLPGNLAGGGKVTWWRWNTEGLKDFKTLNEISNSFKNAAKGPLSNACALSKSLFTKICACIGRLIMLNVD
jgi:hypothetical protein